MSPEHLVDLIVSLQAELLAARQRIRELEQHLPTPPTAKLDQPFSMRAEEQRQHARSNKPQKRKKPKRHGRVTTADKIARAERTEKVFPAGIPPADCRRSHVRPVWRFESGRAVLVAYEIYRGPKNQYGQIPGVFGRSEFAVEIVVAIAFLVHGVGLSFDKVCQVLTFFQQLRLPKSQADALLRQLSRHWEKEFDTLCTLLAHAAVVHADETRWSLNSVWAFLSEQARVLLFGVHKDAGTLKTILDPETFEGVLVSDDAAVYATFTIAQKCWAHLLRKAIKLTLQEPDHEGYRTFTDRLLEIYRAACRARDDGRLSDAGRTARVEGLEQRVYDLCSAQWLADEPPGDGCRNDYRLLVNELMRLMLAKELFPFVTAPAVTQPNGATAPVAGTNNEAERTLRGSADARKTGRTSKTPAGARRRTILMSVLESLRLYLTEWTLASVIAEVTRWMEAGRSCFEDLLIKLKIPRPEDSILDRIFPKVEMATS
ncbi:IS66 family transposase [Fimbriiglobus ruber]|uniref:Transposase IS66 central domain-containing protein n=1 Tax=Fimbriiglobus ruber TaxID=1908690 RepID=A0A225DD75_9BACT|nr:transposase [Fimbriiglobus ruber]OWK35276.1 hypothetical protein FRUB_09437 [Fimbriiglobus ruber]